MKISIFSKWTSTHRRYLKSLYPKFLISIGLVGSSAAQNVTALWGGHETSFYLKSNGSLWATGWNTAGQLGDGNATGQLLTSDAPSSVLVMTQVAAVAASTAGHFTLFLKTDGSVWSAGYNNHGQLGDGTLNTRVVPVRVMSGGVPMTGVTAIAAGASYSAFLKNDGTVWACGYNAQGVLGDETTTNRREPVQVTVGGVPLTGVVAIAAGSSHILYLRSDGAVWGAGANWYGQLASNSSNDHSTPVQVMSGVSAIAAGDESSYFLMPGGGVFAVGGNGSGQLGNGTTTDSSTPVQSLISGVAALSANAVHCLFLKTDGSAWAVGGNYAGELGDGTMINRSTPVLITTGASRVAAGYRHSLFLKSGVAWSTGYNFHGALGDGSRTSRTYPQPAYVAPRHHRFCAVSYSTGGYSLKLNPDGTVSGMGAGYGTTPLQIQGLSNIIGVSGGTQGSGLHTQRRMALDKWGQLWSWSSTIDPVPAPIEGMSDLVSISDSPSTRTVCALKTNGSVWRISASNELTPFTVSQVMNFDGRPLGGVMQVGSSAYSYVALNRDGTVSTWGNNVSGQLGDGTTTDRETANYVLSSYGGPVFGNAVCVASGLQSAYAVKGDGTVWAWGGGYLGNGSTGGTPYPVQVAGLADIVSIYSTNGQRYALKKDGTVWAWGFNTSGQLGDNTTITRLTPVQVKMTDGASIMNLTSVVEVGASDNVAVFFRREDGSVYGCGYNVSGQLGGGSSAPKLVATRIAEY